MANLGRSFMLITSGSSKVKWICSTDLFTKVCIKSLPLQEERAFPRNPEFIADDDLLNQPELEPVYNGKKRSNVSELILLSPSIVTIVFISFI